MATLYVGTYTQREDHVDGHGEGIYSFRLDDATLRVTPLEVMRGLTNPSFLALGRDCMRLYVACETTSRDGFIASCRVTRSGALTLLGMQSTRGSAPCHVTTDGHNVLVANYLGGSVAALPLDSDGCAGAVTHVARHLGSSVNPVRQEAPHPHAIVLDVAERYVLVPDLGTDQVESYLYDRVGGVLTRVKGAFGTRAGSGPRHLAFARSGRFAYLMNELDSTVVACTYAEGQLTEIQTVAALPKSFAGTPSGADIHLHPSGRFLYASLRGINCIVRMRVDTDTGRLSGKAYAHVLGVTPRNFALDPDGKYLVVANQDSDTLVVMAIDADTGLLTPVGTPVSVPSPACVVVGP